MSAVTPARITPDTGRTDTMDDTDIRRAVGDLLDLLADRFPDHVRAWANDRLQCDCPDPSGARDPRLDWA